MNKAINNMTAIIVAEAYLKNEIRALKEQKMTYSEFTDATIARFEQAIELGINNHEAMKQAEEEQDDN